MLDDVVSCVIWAKGTNEFVTCSTANKPLLPFKYILVNEQTNETSVSYAALEILGKLGLAEGSVTTKIFYLRKHIFPDGAGHRKFALSHSFVLAVYEATCPLHCYDNLNYKWTSQVVLQTQAADDDDLTQAMGYFTSRKFDAFRNTMSRSDLDDVPVRVAVSGPHSYEPEEDETSETFCFKHVLPRATTSASSKKAATMQRIVRETRVTKMDEHALHVRFLKTSWPRFTLNLSKFEMLFDWNKIVPVEHLPEELPRHIKRLFLAISFVGQPENYPQVGRPSAKLFKKFITFSDLLLAFTVCQSTSLGNCAGERRALATYAYYADETSGNLKFDGLVRLFGHGLRINDHKASASASASRIEKKAWTLAKRLKPTATGDNWFIEPALFLEARHNTSNRFPTYRLLIGNTIASILKTEWLQSRVSPVIFTTDSPGNNADRTYWEEIQRRYQSTAQLHDQLIKTIATLQGIANEQLQNPHNRDWLQLQPLLPSISIEDGVNSSYEQPVDVCSGQGVPLPDQLPQLSAPMPLCPPILGRIQIQHIVDWLSTQMREWAVQLARLRPIMLARRREDVEEELALNAELVHEVIAHQEPSLSSNLQASEQRNATQISYSPASTNPSAGSNLPHADTVHARRMLNFDTRLGSLHLNASGTIPSILSVAAGGMPTQDCTHDHESVQPQIDVHRDTSSFRHNNTGNGSSTAILSLVPLNTYCPMDEAPRRQQQFPSNYGHLVDADADSSTSSRSPPMDALILADESTLVDVVSVFLCYRSENSTSFALCQYPRGWYMPYRLLHERQEGDGAGAGDVMMTKYEAVRNTAEGLVHDLLVPGQRQLLPRLHGVMHCWRRLMPGTESSVSNQNAMQRSLTHYCVLVTCNHQFQLRTAPISASHVGQTTTAYMKWLQAEEISYSFKTGQLLGDELKQLVAEWEDELFESFKKTMTTDDLPFSGFSFASPSVFHENQLESPELWYLYERAMGEMQVTRQEEAALYFKFTQATWPSLSMNQITFQHFLPIEVWPVQPSKPDQAVETRCTRLYECLCLNRSQYLHYPLLLLGFSVLQLSSQASGVTNLSGERRARYMFHFYDRNHDGHIDFEEFRELLADAALVTNGLLPNYMALANDLDNLCKIVLKKVFSAEADKQGDQFNPTLLKVDMDKFLRSRKLYLKKHRVRLRQSLSNIVQDVRDSFRLPPRFTTCTYKKNEAEPQERFAKISDFLNDLHATAIDIRDFIINQDNLRTGAIQHGVTTLNIAYSNALIQYTMSALRAISAELDCLPPNTNDN